MLKTISTLDEVQSLYHWFKEMRDTQPVWLDESSGCWHVFRYADVNSVTTDYERFSSERRFPAQNRVASATSDEKRRGPGRSILTMDPPQHRQYRNLVSPSFTPRALGRLTGRIGAITRELIDDVRPYGRADFATDIAYPLPTIVIAEMLGVPTSDRPLFRRWAEALLSQQLSDAEFTKPREEGFRESPEMKRIFSTFDEMYDYFQHMLEERQREPGDDMMSELLASEVEGERLNMDDAINFCILLLLAGHVTTTNLLSQAIRCFDEHPDALAQLRKEPALMPSAIEEILRYASPVWRLVRAATTDVTIGGVTIPKDAMIFAWLSSANRDEQQFPEPERFDIARTPNRQIAFGHGIHFCIGAPLSRLEASVALPIIIEQLPHLQRARDEPLELFEGRALFGFKHFPITFTPS